MGFNSAFKGLKLFKKPGNRRLNNLNDPVLNVLTSSESKKKEPKRACLSETTALHSQNVG